MFHALKISIQLLLVVLELIVLSVLHMSSVEALKFRSQCDYSLLQMLAHDSQSFVSDVVSILQSFLHILILQCSGFP